MALTDEDRVLLAQIDEVRRRYPKLTQHIVDGGSPIRRLLQIDGEPGPCPACGSKLTTHRDHRVTRSGPPAAYSAECAECDHRWWWTPPATEEEP